MSHRRGQLREVSASLSVCSISMFLFGFMNSTGYLVAAFIDSTAADGAEAIEVGIVEGRASVAGGFDDV